MSGGGKYAEMVGGGGNGSGENTEVVGESGIRSGKNAEVRMSGNGNGKYAEIINHPRYEPKRHPRMSRRMRAAQFAPYAALTGHAEAVRKTAKFAELRSRRVIEMNMDDVSGEWEEK